MSKYHVMNMLRKLVQCLISTVVVLKRKKMSYFINFVNTRNSQTYFVSMACSMYVLLHCFKLKSESARTIEQFLLALLNVFLVATKHAQLFVCMFVHTIFFSYRRP